MIEQAKWGRDHESTMLYLETRAVDHDGVVKNANMRTHARRHRKLLDRHRAAYSSHPDGAAYPTRLANGEVAEDHDDWDCLEDLQDAGYLTYEQEETFRGVQVTVRLTHDGWQYAHGLRRAKAEWGER